MKRAAGASDARHDCTDGDIENHRDVLVLEILPITKEKHFAKVRLKLIEGLVQNCLIVETDEVIFWGWTGLSGGEELGMVFQKNCA